MHVDSFLQFNLGVTAMIIKILIILFLLTILYSLASSFFFLVWDKGQGDRTIRRLTWRIGLSLVLFVLMWGAHQMGWLDANRAGPVNVAKVAQPPD